MIWAAWIEYIFDVTPVIHTYLKRLAVPYVWGLSLRRGAYYEVIPRPASSWQDTSRGHTEQSTRHVYRAVSVIPFGWGAPQLARFGRTRSTTGL